MKTSTIAWRPRQKLRVGLVTAALLGLALLASAGTATAAGPQPASPPDGALGYLDRPITFKVTSVPGDHVQLEFGTSSATKPGGAYTKAIFLADMTAVPGQPGSFQFSYDVRSVPLSLLLSILPPPGSPVFWHAKGNAGFGPTRQIIVDLGSRRPPPTPEKGYKGCGVLTATGPGIGFVQARKVSCKQAKKVARKANKGHKKVGKFRCKRKTVTTNSFKTTCKAKKRKAVRFESRT